MDTRIRHVVALKVVGSSWSHSSTTKLRNLPFTSHPQICLKSLFANAEKSKPQRVQIPFALSINSKRKIHSLSMIHPCSSFGVRVPFGYELSNSRVRMSISYCGLISGAHSTYFSGTTRLLSRVPGKGTLHDVWTDGNISWKNYLSKMFNKRSKWPHACAVHKNETSTHELAVSSESKATGSKDVKLCTLNGNNDIESSADIVSTQTTKGKEKMKRGSRNKKRQNQSYSASTHSEAADVPNSSVNKLQASETSDNKHKLSHTPLQINSTSSSLTEATENSSSTQNSGKKPSKRSAKTRKRNMNSRSVLMLDGELMAQSDSKVPAGHNSLLTDKSKSQTQKTWPQLYPPITKSVVVVESVTKAKIIQGYLGEMFEVLPSYGHVRDLAARSGSVRPDDDFSMVWEVPSPAWSHLKSIKVALSGAENLILASDPDREGEAIAWHIVEMLKQQDALQEHVTIARVTFNEVTESSVKIALRSPREISADLVHAYLARRALDYLIGFNVSPLLWRKLPGCQSAGRVQSAALALICDREKEIDDFKTQEYWIVNAQFQKNDPVLGHSGCLSSHLTHYDSKRLTSVSSNVEAKDIEEKINVSNFEVVGMTTNKIQRKPPIPYITSTLQQDAINKLNFAASYTMKIAQKLYEGVQLSDGEATGLITYMRTDGLHLSDEAAKDIQSFVAEKYGLNFATKNTRKYFKKVKTALEAHEAIRPTNIRRLPSVLAGVLDEDSLKLYTLIWARTMACQMEPAIIEQIQCDIGNSDQSIMFCSTSSRVGFQGFKAVYEDTETIRIKNEDNDSHHRELFETLSSLKRGKPLSLIKVGPEQHYTQPPPRYSEGSLVKKLEELGIGRPSTYATTIKVLKDRNYIISKNKKLYPEFRGRMVSAFLLHYFSEVTDCCFTANMETELDNVSAGITDWKGLLKDYWTRFSKFCKSASVANMHQVEKMLEKTFGDSLFSSLPDGDRTCPSCLVGTLVFKISRFGAGYFIGCDQHPKCKYIAKTLYGEDEEEIEPEEKKKTNVNEPKVLGVHPGTNEKVLLKCGPYGNYVQLGEDRKGHLPKRASLAHIKKVDSVTLEDALDLLRYPLTLGNHPDDDKPVIVRLSKVGFSVRHRRCIATVPKNLKPGELTLEKAVELLKGNNVRRSGRPKRSPAVDEAIEAV